VRPTNKNTDEESDKNSSTVINTNSAPLASLNNQVSFTQKLNEELLMTSISQIIIIFFIILEAAVTSKSKERNEFVWP